jgi:uncharacterized protein (DUF433 family)
MNVGINPLARGFYTIKDAARLIENARAQRIHGWLKGYPNRDIGPLLDRDYKPFGDRQELSFLDLIEVRFVEHFRAHEVKLRTLRRAADRLRAEFSTPHPFATDQIHLEADKADIFLVVMRESAKEEKDRALLSLTTDNYVLEEIIKRNLVPGITFDRKTHVARKWVPRPSNFPDIVMDPKIAYGQPTVESGVPTSVLLAAWEAEGDLDEVAFWHHVKSSEVQRAVDFEKFLDSQQALDKKRA